MGRFRRVGRRLAFAVLAGALFATLSASVASSAGPDPLRKINHIVVIYEENHSFDNLYGGWEGVNGRANADAAHTTQVDQDGVAFGCLQQLDVNLTSPPLPVTCTDAAHGITSAFTNTWFTIDNYIKPSDTTCPPPHKEFDSAHTNGWAKGTGVPGGCTRDLVHEFYQEQYQLNGGHQNRYMSGSDSVGTTMGVYDTKALPIYRYLHGGNHPHYAIADDLFQSAFGGSFLNHQWLITAQTPEYPGAAETLHSIIDSNGMPTSYPQYHATGPVRRGPITVVCPSPVPGRACGDYAVNTMQPTYQPTGTFGAKLIPQTHTTIGDELSAANVSWSWYSGGWSNADGDIGAPGWTNGTGPTCSDPRAAPNPNYPYCPDSSFQFHHQPFNYYASFAPDTPGRTHLRDEQEFLQRLQSSGSECKLDSVSFDKPLGVENEHPGYSSEPNGSDHLVSLLQAISNSACAKDTMVIVTYDEFGGQWDHVSPPGQAGTAGPHDQWGPGTRIPALVISPFLRGNEVVDHTQYDTTSILATIEERYGLAPLSSRDAAVNSLSNVFTAKQYEAGGH
jgi:acid phosphatase